MSRISPSSYSAYAPLRYEVTRPFVPYLSAKFAASYFPSKLQRSNFFFKEILPEIFEAAAKSKVDPHDTSIELEIDNLKAYTEFLISGRIIYDFHKELSSQLASTQLEGSSLTSLIKPYEAFYLHFGDVEWPGNTVSNVEGAFVSWGNPSEELDYLTIHVIKKRQFSNALFWQSPENEVTEHFSINVSDTPDGIKDQFAEIGNRWRRSATSLGYDNVLASDEVDQTLSHMQAVFTLVVNCLLYLSATAKRLSEAESIADLSRQEGAHSRESESPSQEAIGDALSNQDYLKVNLISSEFVHHQGKHFVTGTNHKKAAHERKGHYRNQRHGPKLSLTKVVFINPTKIHSESDVLPGRIYIA